MNAAVDADTRGIAKTNDESPYTIANEVIAARVGQAIGLPIPAGVIAEDATRKLYYLSLDVSREGKALPPVIPADFAREEPRMTAGCVVFDVLIANGDRNVSNLSRDPAFTPPRVSVFDHGHALLGTNPPTGLDRLQLATGRLGCRDDSALIASNHVLLDQQIDAAELEFWVARVEALPSFVYDDACLSVATTPALHVDRAMAERVAAWLAGRAQRIGSLIWEKKDACPQIQWSLWKPGGQQ